MATGDVLSVVALAEGDCVEVTFSGAVVGGAYNLALDADNVPTSNTPKVDLVSEGYTTGGVLGTTPRTVHLTSVMRKPYPNEAQLQESIVGGNLVVRFSVSDPIYADDKNGGAGTSGTDPTFTAPAGFFTNSGAGGGGQTSAAVSAGAVTNSSTLAYPKVIANWSWPDRSRLTSASLTLRAVAAHGFARGPITAACVKFTASDEHSHSVTTTELAPQLDNQGDLGGKVIGYVSTLSLAGFTDDDLITANVKVFPWVGDASCVFDTAALAQAESGQSPPQKYRLDQDGSHGYPMVVVDPTAANDAGGVVYAADSAPNRATAAGTPYKNIYAAVRAIRDYNSTHSPTGDNANDAAIYLRGANVGTHDWAGGAVFTPLSVTGDRWTWLEIKGYPGDSRATVTPNATQANRKIVCSGVKITSVDFTRSSDAYFTQAPGTGVGKIWCDDSTFTDTRTTNTYALNIFDYSLGGWMTRCTFNKVKVSNPANLRGCLLPNGYSLPQATGVILGLDFSHVAGQTANIISTPSQQANDAEGAIVAFNKFWNLYAPLLSCFQLPATTYTRGLALLQNLVEVINTSAQPVSTMSGDATTSITNGCVIAHNTIVQERCNWFYNDIGSTNTPHTNHFAKLNAFDYAANKGDDFGGNDGPNTNRQGNRAYFNGVGCAGQRIRRGSFNQRFRGECSKGGTDAQNMAMGYVNDLSGATTGAGHGDYRPAAGSVLRNVPVAPLFAWDIDGTARQAFDAAGAYAAPTSRGVLRLGGKRRGGLVFLGGSGLRLG